MHTYDKCLNTIHSKKTPYTKFQLVTRLPSSITGRVPWICFTRWWSYRIPDWMCHRESRSWVAFAVCASSESLRIHDWTCRRESCWVVVSWILNFDIQLSLNGWMFKKSQIKKQLSDPPGPFLRVEERFCFSVMVCFLFSARTLWNIDHLFGRGLVGQLDL